MSDLQWGLSMMVVGMGVVFGLLALLMAVLLLVGRLDRRPEPADAVPGPADAPERAASETSPEVRILADGLDETQLAAIAVAVMTHAEIRRRSASPEARAHAPGSQLFASRWVAIGRGQQNAPYVRS